MVIIEAPETLSIAIIITIDNHYNNFLQGIKRLILLLYSLVLTRSCRCEGNLAAGLYLLVAGGWWERLVFVPGRNQSQECHQRRIGNIGH